MAYLQSSEITEKALLGLNIEAAIRKIHQKEALDALILAGASKEALALTEEAPLDGEQWALDYIQRELRRGRKPTLGEVANHVRGDASRLEWCLAKHGIRGVIYTRSMQTKIETRLEDIHRYNAIFEEQKEELEEQNLIRYAQILRLKPTVLEKKSIEER